MKTLAIYFFNPEPLGYPFNKTEYFPVYKELIESIENCGVEVYVVRGDSYLGKGRFSQGWKFNHGNIEVCKTEIQSDLIFCRDNKHNYGQFRDWKTINHPDFFDICIDKLKTYDIFTDICPKTVQVNSFNECLNTLKTWSLHKENLIVLKQNFRSGGNGINILQVSNIKESLYGNWKNILIQEFTDSSMGIKGITHTLHDLRIMIVDSKVTNAYLRTPKKGSYLANIGKGGTGKAVELGLVPKAAFELVDIINQKIKKYSPSIYSADFIHSSKGFKLIELNSVPGLLHPNWAYDYKKFNNAIVDLLVREAS